MNRERLIRRAASVVRCWRGQLAVLIVQLVCAGCAATSASTENPADCCTVRPDAPQISLGALLFQVVPKEDREQSLLTGLAFTDQNGKRHDERDLVGKPLALSFIYTRCENPARCPATTKSMAELQRQIEQSGLGSKLNVALATFDPQFDTPDKLAAYADVYAIEKDGRLLLLAPDLSSSGAFFERIRMPVNYEKAGRPNGHGTLLLLLDKEGRIAERREVVFGDTDSIVQSLEHLANE